MITSTTPRRKTRGDDIVTMLRNLLREQLRANPAGQKPEELDRHVQQVVTGPVAINYFRRLREAASNYSVTPRQRYDEVMGVIDSTFTALHLHPTDTAYLRLRGKLAEEFAQNDPDERHLLVKKAVCAYVQGVIAEGAKKDSLHVPAPLLERLCDKVGELLDSLRDKEFGQNTMLTRIACAVTWTAGSCGLSDDTIDGGTVANKVNALLMNTNL